MKTYHSLCLLFILVYTRGAIERMGLPDIASKFIVECSLIFLLYPILRHTGNRKAPGGRWVAGYVALTVLSGIASGDGIYQSLLYFRWLLYTYLVFWAVWNARLTRKDMLRLNTMILGLWILQVAASLFHMFVLGERVEAHVGTLTAGSGSPATVFPIFAMVYVLAFYYYKRSVWMIVLALSFILVGYASGKRAVFFFVPAVYAGSLLWYVVRERIATNLRVLVAPAAVFVACIPLLIFGLVESKRFDHLRGLPIGTFAAEALKVAEEYDNRVYASGETFGRTANSKAMVSRLFGDESGDYLLGLGPASMRPSSGDRAKAEMGIAYGAVGWVENTMSVGWPAMFAHIVFYLLLWSKVYRRRPAMTSNYAKALHFGCHLGFAVYFLMYFTYTYSYAMAGWLTFVQVYCVAIVLSPKHEGLLLNETVYRRQCSRVYQTRPNEFGPNMALRHGRGQSS